MKSLINDIEIGGVRDALDILAKAGSEDLFEKAKHQIGDSHPKWPQLKWTDLGGGKFGWRTINGRRARAGNTGQANTTESHAKETDTKTLKNVVDSDKAPKDLKDAAKKELQNRGEQAQPAKTDTTEKKKKSKHQIGDSHPTWPQLKWTDLGNGKFGWRTDRGKKTSTSNSGEQASQEKPAKTDTTEKKEEKKLRPVGTGTLGPTKREKDVSKKTSTSVVKETSTVDEMINQVIASIEGTTGRKLSYKEKDNIRTKVASYNIKVKSDWDISKEATEGLHVMIGDWKQNEFEHEIENNSIEELQSKITKQNKNIKDAQDRYESIHSQMKKYYGTMPPHNLNQSYTAVREQLALERCKKLYIENEIEKRKKAAKILNDYVKGVK